MLRAEGKVQPFILKDQPDDDHQVRDGVCSDEALCQKGYPQRRAGAQRLEDEKIDNVGYRKVAFRQGPAAGLERFESGAKGHSYRTGLPPKTKLKGL